MLQIIVLLAIMAIWALTSLLSREAQPLPPASIRRLGPDGTRPAPIGRTAPVDPGRSASTGQGLAGAALERRPASRPSEPFAASPARPAPGRGLAGDGIVILETDARGSRPPSGVLSPSPAAITPRNPRGGQARRASRGRSSTGSPTKAAEPGRPRALTTQVTQSMAQKKNRALEITPLANLLAPMGTPLTQLSTSVPLEQPKTSALIPAFNCDSLRAMLSTTSKLREIAIVTEILQPPLALRRHRRMR